MTTYRYGIPARDRNPTSYNMLYDLTAFMFGNQNRLNGQPSRGFTSWSRGSERTYKQFRAQYNIDTEEQFSYKTPVPLKSITDFDRHVLTTFLGTRLLIGKRFLLTETEATIIEGIRYGTNIELHGYANKSKKINNLEMKGFKFNTTMWPHTNKKVTNIVQMSNVRLCGYGKSAKFNPVGATEFIKWFNFDDWEGVLTYQMKLIISFMIDFKNKRYNSLSIHELQIKLKGKGLDVDQFEIFETLNKLFWLGFEIDWVSNISLDTKEVKFQLWISRLCPLYKTDKDAIFTWVSRFRTALKDSKQSAKSDSHLSYGDMHDGVSDWDAMCKLFTETYGGELTLVEQDPDNIHEHSPTTALVRWRQKQPVAA